MAMPPITELPYAIASRIIIHSDPESWWNTGNRSIRQCISSTSFRVQWASQLALTAQGPRLAGSVEAADKIEKDVFGPIDSLSGSAKWLTRAFVRGLKANHARALDIISTPLLRRALLDTDYTLASEIADLSAVFGRDLSSLDGAIVRQAVDAHASTRMLSWFASRGLDISKMHNRDVCFDFGLLAQWTMDARTDLLEYLHVRWALELPVRSLLEYALPVDSPAVVEFLMQAAGPERSKPTWDELVLIACTYPPTSLPVFRMVLGHTSPSLVWTHAALSLAAFSETDDTAYSKFKALMDMPGAADWLCMMYRGATPVQRLCGILTFENMWTLTPFIRDYISLGVPDTGMPDSLSFICQ